MNSQGVKENSDEAILAGFAETSRRRAVHRPEGCSMARNALGQNQKLVLSLS